MSKSWMFALWFTVVALQAGSAFAQVVLPTLPEVQAINASAQFGNIVPSSSTIPKTDRFGRDLWGWGVETEFQLPLAEDKPWRATLALGYNQLNLSADIYSGRRLRGTLRDLPALSLYFGRTSHGWYAGVTIAESELVNGRLLRAPDPGMQDPGPIKVAANSFSAGLSVGLEHGPLFIEFGYMGRYFPSLQYDGIPTGPMGPVFPADLGQRMYAGGFVLRIGGTLEVKKDTSKETISCGHASAEYTVPTGRRGKANCTEDGLTVTVPRDPAPEPKQQ